MSKKISLKKDTIKNLQKYISAKVKERGFEDESLHERLLLLVEEIGELTHACRKISGMNIDKNRKIQATVGEEITDCLNLLFCVAIELDLDVEKEFLQKEAIIDKRSYARSTAKHKK